MCSRLASVEKGASPRLSLAMGIWCSSAKAISRVAAGQVPLAPGGDDLDVGIERVVAELEAHLVVALAGGAVGDGVGADLAGDLDLALRDQRPGDRGAEQVDPLVERVGAEHRHHEVLHEDLAQVLDEDVLRLDAEHLGLAARRLQLLALAEVGGEGDDLRRVLVLQPLQDDRGVEPAGVGKDDLLDGTGLRHGSSPLDRRGRGDRRSGGVGQGPGRRGAGHRARRPAGGPRPRPPPSSMIISRNGRRSRPCSER